MNNPREKRSFTEKEAATYIGMSRSYLRQSRMTGVLRTRTSPPRFIKVGTRAVRYLREDLDHWLEQFAKHIHTHEPREGQEEANHDIT